jgi:hypothetical protein
MAQDIDKIAIYAASVIGEPETLCGGGQDNDGSMESCVRYIPVEGGVALQDTKLGDGSPELRFDVDELRALGRKIRDEHGLDV